MTEDFNPTEWITTKEAAELAGVYCWCLVSVRYLTLPRPTTYPYAPSRRSAD
jgi:hypothetical protein